MKMFYKPGLCGELLIAGFISVCVSVHGAEPVKADYSGSLQATYDYRGLGSYSDQDGYAYWYLRGRNIDDHVDIYTSGRLHADLDGSSSAMANDPFASIDEASRQDEVRLLQLYVDLHDRNKNMVLRGGRQYVDVADYIQMDGIQAMLFENKKLGGRVFFGLPVSYYTSTSEDLFGGVSIVGNPWKGNRSRATYARYQDDSEDAADDHYFLDMRQQITDELRARAYLSIMNEDVRMGGADLFYMSLSEKVFDATLGVRRWGTYDANTRVYSPLVEVLGDQEPYTTAYGRFTTQVMPSIYLSPGVMLRHPDDSNPTNTRFERYDVALIYEPVDALSASISLEYWDADDDRFYGIGGDIRYRYHKIWEVSAGAAYLDYTYFDFPDFSLTADGGSTIVGEDGVRVEVSPNAYTYYLRGKWNIRKNLALRVSGEIEDDSTESDLGYRIRTTLEVRL